jgi:hypothetical protein
MLGKDPLPHLTKLLQAELAEVEVVDALTQLELLLRLAVHPRGGQDRIALARAGGGLPAFLPSRTFAAGRVRRCSRHD